MPYEWEMKAEEVGGHTQPAVHVMCLMQIAVVSCSWPGPPLAVVYCVGFHK